MLQEVSTNQASPKSITTFRQAEFKALVRGWGISLAYGAQSIAMYGSKMEAVVDNRAIIQADYGPLYKSDLVVAFKVDKHVLKGLKRIGGAGDVNLVHDQASGAFAFQGDHIEQAVAVASPASAAPQIIPPVTLLGEEVAKYSVKALKDFIGRDAGKVVLAVYGDQLERLVINGNGNYTFTSGMMNKLATRSPDSVLNSRVAFRYFGDKQALQLGKIGDSYVLKVATKVDMGVTMVVWEQLDVVR